MYTDLLKPIIFFFFYHDKQTIVLTKSACFLNWVYQKIISKNDFKEK